MSASLPGSRVPIRSSQRSASEATRVPAWIACIGVMPACTREANSCAFTSGGKPPKSEPTQIFTPALIASPTRRSNSPRVLRESSTFFCISGLSEPCSS